MPATVTLVRPTLSSTDSVPVTTFNSLTLVSATVPDATPSVYGAIRLAGDLAGSAAVPQLAPSGVSAGSYGESGDTVLSLSIDAKGRVTAVSQRPLADTGVTPGEYGATNLMVPQFTVNAKGRITAAADRDLTSTAVAVVLAALYPPGEILLTLRAGNPSTWLGFGVWEPFAQGRAIVGHDASQTEFNLPEKVGGAKTHQLTEAEMPEHQHLISPPTAITAAGGAHTHALTVGPQNSSSSGGVVNSPPQVGSGSVLGSSTTNVSTAAAHTHILNMDPFESGINGANAPHNNLQPYVVVFAWKRVG